MREFKKLPLELFIGYDIEQNSRVIELDASEMVEKYPSGILQLVCKRPGEETTYIAPSFEQDGGTLRWTLTSYDVEKAGQGLAIVALVDTSEESVKVLASHKIRTGIEEGLHFRDAETVDPEDSLIARVLAAVSQAQAYAQDAKEEADRAEAALDDVDDAKDQAIADIEAKGAETLDSIPSDYTTLSGDVSDLKSDMQHRGVDEFSINNKAYADYVLLSKLERHSTHLNLFDKESVIANKKIAADGSLADNNGYKCSVFMRTYDAEKLVFYHVNNNLVVRPQNNNFCAFYDTDFALVGSVTIGETSATVPTGAIYFRIAFSNGSEDSAMVFGIPSAGTYTPTAFVPFMDGEENEYKFISDIEEVKTDIDNIENNIDEIEKNYNDLFGIGLNKFNPNTTTAGYIGSSGGNIVASAMYFTSDFIDTSGFINGYAFTPAARKMLFYDANKNPIAESYHDSNTPAGVIEINANYKYARFSWTTSATNVMVADASQIPAYEPYTVLAANGINYLNDDTKTALDALPKNDILTGKKWAVCGDSFTAGVDSGTIDSGKYAGEKIVYPYLIGNRTGINVLSFFLGGRTLAFPATPGSFVNSLTCPSQTFYYQNIPADVDYITIYLGINDEHHATGGGDDEDPTGIIPLGTINDNTTDTYYGAWNVVLSWLIENRPFAHIGIIITNGLSITGYRTAQLEIAQKYGIPYIDLNGDSRTPVMIRSINTDIASAVRTVVTRKQAVDYDGTRTGSSNLHPNNSAHEYESYFIENFLRSL